MITFFMIAIPSFGAGVLAAVLFKAFAPRRRRDAFTQGAENEIYGDVPHVGSWPSGDGRL